MLLRLKTQIHSVDMLSDENMSGYILLFSYKADGGLHSVEVMLESEMIGECKVCVRALSIKCSHRRAGEGLQSNVKITHVDLLNLNVCVCM